MNDDQKMNAVLRLLMDKYGTVHAGLPGEICRIFHQVPARLNVFDAVDRERAYQDNKWGTIQEHPHEVAGWILVMRKELDEAEDAWVHNGGDVEALREILQVVATGVACLEQHGVVEREKAGHGIPRSQSGREG